MFNIEIGERIGAKTRGISEFTDVVEGHIAYADVHDIVEPCTKRDVVLYDKVGCISEQDDVLLGVKAYVVPLDRGVAGISVFGTDTMKAVIENLVIGYRVVVRAVTHRNPPAGIADNDVILDCHAARIGTV